MRSARIGLATALLSVVVALPTRALAADPDPWLGKDKALHFGASAVIAAGGYGAGALFFESRGSALILGGALAAAAGIGKEALDLAGLGDPSWRDLTWDGIGAVTGLAVAWTSDLLIRGVSEKHPLFVSPVVSRDSARVQVVVAF